MKSINLNFCFLGLKTKGNNYRGLRKCAENGLLQEERRSLEGIHASSPNCLLAVSFGETFPTLHQRVDRVRFFLENLILHSRSKIDVERVEVQTVSWPLVRCPSAKVSASKLLIEKCEN